MSYTFQYDGASGAMYTMQPSYPIYPMTTTVRASASITPYIPSSGSIQASQARQAAEYHEKLAVQRAQEAERWENRPKAPRADKDGARIIWARKSFRREPKKMYDYAGVYAKEVRRWFLTGAVASRSEMTWDQLLEHLFLDAEHIEIWDAVTWEKLV